MASLSAIMRPSKGAAAPPHLLDRLAPLFECRNERAGWMHVADVIESIVGADVATALEFVDTARGAVRAWTGTDGVPVGTTMPIAPDAQAAFVGACDTVVISPDLLVENRFVAAAPLVAFGIRSSMTRSISFSDGGRAIVGAHSLLPDRFDSADIASFDSLSRLVEKSMNRVRSWGHLELNARVDSVTGLANRVTILDQLRERLAADLPITAMIIDVDGFKAVNDAHGHRHGDHVLRTLAGRIERLLAPGDSVGRLGGDELLLLTSDTSGTELAERLIGHVEEVIAVESAIVQVSASVGIARKRHSDDWSSLLERADQMMYRAKATGRGRVSSDDVGGDASLHTATPTPARSTAISLADVDEAVAGLRVVVQPIVSVDTNETIGVEALARGPRGHALEFPDRLFPVATTFGRLAEVELQAKRLAFELPLADGVGLFVNLEPVLVADASWMQRLAEAWHEGGRPGDVTVELTERSVLTSPGRLLRAVEMCRELGWKVALDDVGARSESLAALRWIKPDIVKLDMRLISGSNQAHAAHVTAAISSYRNHRQPGDVRVIAEGVETEDDVRTAGVLGADLLQGFYFGRPLQIDEPAVGVIGERSVRGLVERTEGDGGDRIATKRQLIAMTRHVEASAVSADAIVLAATQCVSNVSRRTARQYQSLARRCGFVGMLGNDITTFDDEMLRGVRLADLAPDDPLVRCWQVISMSPNSSLALLATEVEGEPAPSDLERRFSYRYVTDPDEVEDAARRLLRFF